MSELLRSLQSEWQLTHHGAIARAPLYHRLYSVLKDAILDGTIPYNAQMPTEQQLSKAFDVSRITAKRAMDELASDNLVARFRGKGSLVTYQYTPKPVRAPLVGMLENLVEIARHGSVQFIAMEVAVPPADVREILGLSETDTAHKVVRVCSNDHGEPYVFYRSWTVGITKGFTRKRFENTVRLELLRENGIHLTQVEQIISAGKASAAVAHELELEPGAAVLSIRRIGQVESGKVVDVLDGWYNPERFQYVMVSSFE